MSAQPESFCAECGSPVEEGTQFCATCGTPTAHGELHPSDSADTASPASETDEPRKKRWKRWIPIAAVVIVAAVGFVLVSTLLTSGNSPIDYLLLGEQRRGEPGLYDMYVARAGAEFGNDDRIARDVQTGSIRIYADRLVEEYRTQSIVALPSGDVAVGYRDDETNVVAIGRPSNWETTSVAFDSTDRFDSIYEMGSSGLTLVEYRDDGSQRCFVFGPGEEADKLARSAQGCSASLTLGAVFVVQDASDGELDVMVTDLEGNELTELSGIVDRDGALTAEHLFYVDGASDNVELVAVEWRSGDEAIRSDSYASIDILDSVGDTVVFVGDDGDGLLDLSVVTGTGEVQVIAQVPEVEAVLSADGRWVFYATGDGEGDWDVFGFSVGSQSDGEVDLDLGLSNVSYLELQTPTTTGSGDPLLIVVAGDGENYDIYGGTPGTGLSRFYTGSSSSVSTGAVGDKAFLGGAGSWSGIDEPLYAYDISTDQLIEMDERWDSAYWVDATEEGTALIIAAEGNEQVLYFVTADDSPDVIELDSADRFDLAAFSPDGTTVWYSIEDRGDVEVRRVTITDDPEPETVYEDITILDTVWERGFESTVRSSSFAAAYIDEAAKECLADGLQVIEYGDSLTVVAGAVSGSHEICVTLREEATFEVTAITNNGTDLTLTVTGGYDLGFNDDYNGSDPYVRLESLPPGTYRVQVSAYDPGSWIADFELVTAPAGYSESTS